MANSDWTFEGSDESVGIFGSAWIHESCADNEEYDPVNNEVDTTFVKRGDKVIETVTVKCANCQAKEVFTDEWPASMFYYR